MGAIEKEATVRETLEMVFKDGAPVRGNDGRIIGRGIFQGDLVQMGFTKRELRVLVHEGLLQKVTTRFQNCWRNTYVFPMKVEAHEIKK